MYVIFKAKNLNHTSKVSLCSKNSANPEVKFLLRHYRLSFRRTIGSHRASNERSYIHPCPLLCVSLLYPLALPSPLSSGGVIDRLQRFRPPTALSSFRDTLSVLIRAVIGRLAVAEWDQGHGSRETTMTFLRYHLQFFFLTFHPNSQFFFFSLHWFVKFTLNENIYSFVCCLVCFPLMLVSNSTFVDHSLKGGDDRIDNG